MSVKDTIIKIWPDLTVSREIGRGPFSVVYETSQATGGSPADVVKVISFTGGHETMNAVSVDLQFMQQIKATGAVADIRDYRVFERNDGYDIFVRMEKLIPLSQMIGRRTFSTAEVLKIAQDLCDDLKVIDDQGAMHLNIKPSNILMDSNGHYKLADLCSTRRLEVVMGVSPAVGSMAYIAPEMLAGRAFDIRADIFAVGRVLTDIMPDHAPADLKQVVAFACDADPERRMMKPEAMKNALSFIKTGDGGAENGEIEKRQVHTQKPQSAPMPEPPVHQSFSGTQSGGQNQPAKKKSVIPIIIGIVVALIVLIVGAVVVLGMRKGKDDDDSTAISQPAGVATSVNEESKEAESEAKASESQASESQTSETKAGETKAGETKAGETKKEAGTSSGSASSGKAMDRSSIKAATASSYLVEPEYDLTHDAGRLIDGDTTTAWAEDVAGQGEGQWVKLELSETCMVSGFNIYNGHQITEDLYWKNSRPSRLKVRFSDNSEQTFDLADQLGKQTFKFDKPVETDSVTFTIVSVYGGYGYEDTCISEIGLEGTVK